MIEKYIVFHKKGIRSDDKNGGYFESYHSYSRDNYTDIPMRAKMYSSLKNALKHRVGLSNRNIKYAIQLKQKFDKQVLRLRKLNRISNLNENDGIDFENIIFFENDKGEEITKIEKIIIDENNNISLFSANKEIYDIICNIVKKNENEIKKLHKFTLENTNPEIIIDNPDDEFWN